MYNKKLQWLYSSPMRCALVFLLTLPLAESVRADSLTTFAGDWITPLEEVNGLPWSKPLKVSPPHYPAKALASRTSGSVEVTATNDLLGRAKIIRIEANPPGMGFEEAVIKAFDAWDFDTETDGDCRPVRQPHMTRILFEADGGEPRIKVTRRQQMPPRDGAFANLANRAAMSKEIARLAGGLRYEGEANALIAVQVDGATGEALKAEVTAINGTGRLGLLMSALPRAYLKAEFKVPEQFRSEVFISCHFYRLRLGLGQD